MSPWSACRTRSSANASWPWSWSRRTIGAQAWSLTLMRIVGGTWPVPRQKSFEASELGIRLAWSGGPVVLVDHPTQDRSSVHGGVEVDHDARIMLRRMLVSALMRPMPIEMALVVPQHVASVVF